MQKRLCNYISKASRSASFIIAAICVLMPYAKAAQEDLTISSDLRLMDGRQISLRLIGDSPCHEMSLRTKEQRYLWDRAYCTDFDLLWYHPFFVPLKAGHYEVDLDGDGYPEIGIAVWDGGNHPELGEALIFTVRERKLVPYGKKNYHIESGMPLLP